jgi:hypothetical protein
MNIRNFIFILFFIVPIVSFANRGKIKIDNTLVVKKVENLNSSDVPDKFVRLNQLLTKMQHDFPSYIQDIAYKIGNNANLEIDQNVTESMKNFDLVFTFSCIPDETSEPLTDGPYAGTAAEYAFFLHIELIDPYTNRIVGSYSIEQVYHSNTLLSGNEQANYAIKLFSDDNMPTIDKMEADITRMATYNKASIIYNGNNRADGETKGEIRVSNIVKRLIGEAPNNSISAFELRCKKGKFIQTNSKKVRFEGNEYFHKYDLSIPFVYQTYNCNDYEDNESDEFTLVQIARFNEKIEEKIVHVENIRFNCSSYNVYAHYYCNGFADAQVVWENVQINIPDDKSKINIIDASTFEDEDKKIGIPYGVKIPGYGIEYYFSECANESETPKVEKMKSLIEGGICFLDTSDDALNNFSIETTPEHPNDIRVLLQFDMYIGESKENSQQMTVGTDSEFPGGTEFFWKNIDDDILKKLQAGEYAQKVLTNQGGCKLTITFKPQ